MEEPFKKDISIVEDETYKLFKDEVICPLYYNYFYEPVICIKCNKSFCKNWIF